MRELESSVTSPVLWLQKLLVEYSFSAFFILYQACFPGCSGYFTGRMAIKERPDQGRRNLASFLVKNEE
jgi:hypothetical protein